MAWMSINCYWYVHITGKTADKTSVKKVPCWQHIYSLCSLADLDHVEWLQIRAVRSGLTGVSQVDVGELFGRSR